MAGLGLIAKGADFSGLGLAQIPVPSAFDKLSVAPIASYNFYNAYDSYANAKTLQAGGTAVFDQVNHYLDITDNTGYVDTAITRGNTSFCAVITFKVTNLSATRIVFGDYDENVLASTTGLRIALTNTGTGISVALKNGAGANTSISMTLASTMLNKWKTLVLNVNYGTSIRLTDELGQTVVSTDATFCSYAYNAIRSFRFGRQYVTASVGQNYFIGNGLHMAMFAGSQSDEVVNELFAAAEVDLVSRGFAYG